MDVVVLGICGGSGSGKSTLATAFATQLADEAVAILPFDAYYHDLGHLSPEERRHTNFDQLDALDVELYATHLDELCRGNTVRVPGYDFATHTRTGESSAVDAAPLVIAEGILLLASPVVSSRLDLTVFLDVEEDLRLERRLARDIVERGREESDVRRHFAKSVAPSHDRLVQPLGLAADFVHRHPWDVMELAVDLVASIESVRVG